MNKNQFSCIVDASMYRYPCQNHSLVDMEGEIWKPVHGFEEYFSVSNLGRIKRLERWDCLSNGKRRILREKILVQRTNKTILKSGKTSMPSLFVSTNIEKQRYCIIISRAVYSTFVEKLNPVEITSAYVLHHDLDPFNNRVENLYLANSQERNLRNLKAGLNIVSFTTVQAKAKLKEVLSKPISQYSPSGNFINSYPSIIEAQRQTGIDSKSIINTAKEKASHAGGYIWRYDTDVQKLDDKILTKYANPIKMPVNQYTADGCLVGSYRTVQFATKSLSYSDRSYRELTKLLKESKGVAFFKGHVWKYATL